MRFEVRLSSVSLTQEKKQWKKEKENERERKKCKERNKISSISLYFLYSIILKFDFNLRGNLFESIYIISEWCKLKWSLTLSLSLSMGAKFHPIFINVCMFAVWYEIVARKYFKIAKRANLCQVMLFGERISMFGIYAKIRKVEVSFIRFSSYISRLTLRSTPLHSTLSHRNGGLSTSESISWLNQIQFRIELRKCKKITQKKTTTTAQHSTHHTTTTTPHHR